LDQSHLRNLADLDCGRALLLSDIQRLLVLSQPNKARMPQVAVRGHFQKLELPHQHRHQPPALRHFRRRHDHDLERYYLGMVKDEAELGALEEHLLWCSACVERAAATADYVDAVRAAACFTSSVVNPPIVSHNNASKVL
jgi:hypothetical protein